MNYVYNILKPVTEEVIRLELDSVLRAIPSWRYFKAVSFRFDRDRYVCAKAYLLLKQLLELHYGIASDVEFGYGKYGKPFLKDYPYIHFNFSHCPKAVFCAVSDDPIGVDVEEIQFDEDVARESFSEDECHLIRSSQNPEIQFTEYWTKKEAYLKLIGTGMADNLKSLLDHPQSPVEFRTEIIRELGIVTSIAQANLSI